MLNDDFQEELVESRYADLLVDDVFKSIFGQEANKDITLEFLNQLITDRTIVDVEWIDKEMQADLRDKKNSVYDMNCHTDDGSRIIVEVQRRKQWSYTERAIYYSTFQIRNQVDAGAGSYEFCPVYVINILNFNLDVNKANDEVKTVYRLYEEKTHELLTDKYTLIFVELKKFLKTVDELDGDLLEGFYFCLRHMPRLDSQPEVLKHKVFDKLFSASELQNMDNDKRLTVLRKMTTERDLRNQFAYAVSEGRAQGMALGLEEGRAKGHAEGHAEGRAKGHAEGHAEGHAKGHAEGHAKGHAEGRAEGVEAVAMKMKEMKIPYDVIMEATGLSEEVISSL